jgi:PTS system mannose-specific IIB component
MPIVLMRVDNRFIHGQILEGWLPWLGADQLIIANDEVATDGAQRRILETALTYPIGLIIDSVERATNLLLQEEIADVKRAIIVSHPVDALRMKRAGVSFGRLILGNLGARSEPLPLSNRVMVGPAGRQALREIINEGVTVSIQGLPTDDPVDLTQICSCF